MIISRRHKKGFTLVELMIAMSIFSFILLFAVGVFVQINKIYIKGITTKRMGDQSRVVLADLNNTISQSNSMTICREDTCGEPSIKTTDISDPNKYTICFADKNISYQWKISGDSYLRKINKYICSSTGTPIPSLASEGSGNLLDSSTSVKALNLQPVGGDGSGAWQLDLVVTSQRNNQLDASISDPMNIKCKSGISDQYCAVIRLSTIVRRPLSLRSAAMTPTTPLPPGPTLPSVADTLDLSKYYPNPSRAGGYYLEGENAITHSRSVLAFGFSEDGSGKFRQYNYAPDDSEARCHYDEMQWIVNIGLVYSKIQDVCIGNGHNNTITYNTSATIPGIVILPPSSWKLGAPWNSSGDAQAVYTDNALSCPDGSPFRVTGTNHWETEVISSEEEIAPGVKTIRVRSLQMTTWNNPNCVKAGQRVAGDVTKYEENYYLIDKLKVGDTGADTDYALKRDVGGNITSAGNPVGGEWQFDVWFNEWKALPAGWQSIWSL